MRSMLRTARGPNRAPGRLETPRSIGTPTSAISRPTALAALGRPRNVGMPEYGNERLPSPDWTWRAAATSTGSSLSNTSRSAYRARNFLSLSSSIWVTSYKAQPVYQSLNWRTIHNEYQSLTDRVRLRTQPADGLPALFVQAS